MDPKTVTPAAPDVQPAAQPAVTSNSSSLPSIETLFSESWTLFKKGFWKLLGFNLIMFGIFFLVFMVATVILLIAVGGSLLAITHGNFSSEVLGTFGIGFILALLLVLIAALLVGSVTQAGSMLVVNNAEEGIETIIKKAFHFAIPLFLLSLVTFFLMVPPFFLFFFPALFVAFFLYFSAYAVVIGNYGVLQSLRRSAYLVKSHFGGMLLRAFLMIAVFFLIGIIFSVFSIITRDSIGLGLLFGILRLVVGVVAGWFVIAYTITLYKQAEALEPDKQKGTNLLWFVALSLISLVVAGFVIMSIVKAVQSNPQVKDAFMSAFNASKNSSTVSNTSTSTSSSDFVKQGYKTEFVKSCVQGGASTTTCTCIADYMINNYTTDELLQISQKYSQTKQIPQELTTAAQSCTAK